MGKFLNQIKEVNDFLACVKFNEAFIASSCNSPLFFVRKRSDNDIKEDNNGIMLFEEASVNDKNMTGVLYMTNFQGSAFYFAKVNKSYLTKIEMSELADLGLIHDDEMDLEGDTTSVIREFDLLYNVFAITNIAEQVAFMQEIRLK